jgi:hypothetical protein
LNAPPPMSEALHEPAATASLLRRAIPRILLALEGRRPVELALLARGRISPAVIYMRLYNAGKDC